MTECLGQQTAPIIAATDYVRAFADQVRGFLPGRDYIVLGTDGFGRSDTREKLRAFFEVDRFNIAYAALYALCRQNQLSMGELVDARQRLGVDPEKINPVLL